MTWWQKVIEWDAETTKWLQDIKKGKIVPEVGNNPKGVENDKSRT
jgi:hypothetical protein